MSRWNTREALEPLALRLDTTSFVTATSLLGTPEYQERRARGRDLLCLPVAVYPPLGVQDVDGDGEWDL